MGVVKPILQWELVHPLLPRKVGKGRNQEVPLREIVNAIFYWLRTGYQWRDLPHDFPPHDTVFYHYNKWTKNGVERRTHERRAYVRRGFGTTDGLLVGLR